MEDLRWWRVRLEFGFWKIRAPEGIWRFGDCTKIWKLRDNECIIVELKVESSLLSFMDWKEKKTQSEEIPVVDDAGLGWNSSLGLAVDRLRNRVVVIADVIGNKYSAMEAYDLTMWY
ncbi:calcium-dependent phosphotriesterase superfamily protein [Striga asiatica]|uniref:Calcium-dependent phosphotriesterase superfamily protein n=1 Tax=Striga asiatica TaxID=4170 RepID=A0A5A7QKZ5_STRAF|nr:calcium-dependent phosphotriesterase superfamily protein [Striga asiatica]